MNNVLAVCGFLVSFAVGGLLVYVFKKFGTEKDLRSQVKNLSLQISRDESNKQCDGISHNSQVRTLSTENSYLQSENTRLRNGRNSAEAERSSAWADNRNLRNRCSVLEQENLRLMQESGSKDQTIESLRMDLNLRNQTIESLRTDPNRRDTDINRLNSIISRQNDTILGLAADKFSLLADLDKMYNWPENSEFLNKKIQEFKEKRDGEPVDSIAYSKNDNIVKNLEYLREECFRKNGENPLPFSDISSEDN